MDIYKTLSEDLSIMTEIIQDPELDGTAEEIFQFLAGSINESLQPEYFRITQNILWGKYKLDDDNFQSFIRMLVHIILNSDDSFELNAQYAAIYLIIKYMKIDEIVIHSIRDLEITDSFLEIFGDEQKRLSDEHLISCILTFFQKISFHCLYCHHYFLSRLIQHSNSIERIKKYLDSVDPIDKKIIHKCLYLSVCFFRYSIIPDTEQEIEEPTLVADPEQLELFKTFIEFFTDSFVRITTYPEAETKWLFYAFHGLFYIINNNDKEIWHPLFQSLIDENAEVWLVLASGMSNESNYTDPHILRIVLELIEIWYRKGETIENFNYSLIVDLLKYNYPAYENEDIELIQFFVANLLSTLTQRKGTKIIDTLLENNILEASMELFKNASYNSKKEIASYASNIACSTTKEIKRQMIDMGYLNLFVEVLEPSGTEFISLLMDGICALFASFTCEEFSNPCIDIFQQAGGLAIITEINADDDMDEELLEKIEYFLQEYFDCEPE